MGRNGLADQTEQIAQGRQGGEESLNMFAEYQSLLLSRQVMSDSLPPHGLQHARLSCPSPSPGVCANSRPRPLSR